MTKVIMQHTTTGQTMLAFTCENVSQANSIAAEMNRLNSEAARLTGSIVRYVYTVIGLA